MSNLLKKLITILAIVVTAGVIYMFTFGSGDEDAGVVGLTGNSEVELKTQKILADTQEINGYLEDVSLFEDARFTSLQDFRVQLVDTPTGRMNPFEPVR